MKRPPKPEIRGVREILVHLLADIWLRGLLVAFLAAVGLHRYWFTGLDGEASSGDFLVPALLLAALVARLAAFGQIEDDDERLFWRNVTLALGLWLVILGLHSIPPISQPGSPDLRIGIGIGYALFFILLLIAAEQQVHRPLAWRPNSVERAIRWPALTFFVLSLSVYLVILPMVFGTDAPRLEDFFAPEFAFFLSLDLFVALRFTALTLVARTLRWRFVYGAFAVSMAIAFVSDLLQAAIGIWGTRIADAIDPALGATLWLAPFLAFGATLTLGQLPYSPITERAGSRSQRPTGSRLGDLAKAGGGATIAWALFFPTLHVILHRADLVDPALREPREILVMVATVLLGASAFLEQRYQQERVDSLWQEQVSTEGRMRSSANDLRLMVERQRTRAELERSEEKFAGAFRASPDGLALADPDHCIIQDANASFCRIFDLDPDQAKGAEGSRIGLFEDKAEWLEVSKRLRREGSVRDVGARLELPSTESPGAESTGTGSTGTGPTGTGSSERSREAFIRLSFEIIQAGMDPLLLIIARDLSEGELASWRLDEKADALVNARGAVVATERNDRIVLWSTGAEKLYGTTAARMLGHIYDPRDPKARGTAAAAHKVEVADRMGRVTATVFLHSELPDEVRHALDHG